MNICPCGSGKPYSHCCQPLHNGTSVAETAEQLMRSRYSAFATENVDYLVETHDKTTRSKTLKQELESSMGEVKWLRLEVMQTQAGQANDTEGTVQFTAHYLEDGRPGKMTELSKFKKKKGVWFYVSGV